MTQNDKTTKAATAELVMAKLDDLVIQRQAFQAEYDQVNDTLFDLLAQCLDVYLTTKGGEAEKNVLEAIKEAKQIANQGFHYHGGSKKHKNKKG